MWRAATPADEPRVVELYLALDAEDPGAVPADPERPRRTLALFRAHPERGRCLVLEEDATVRGYALLVPYWSNELGGMICHVDELYVAPAARGHGHARALLASLRSGAVGWPGTVAIQLEVSPSNVRARALYEGEGFAPVRNASMRLRL